MTQLPPDHDDDAGDDDRRRAGVVALAVIAALALAGWGLATLLHRKSALEDCLLAGHKNCAPIEASSVAR